MKEERTKRLNAKVVLCRCPSKAKDGASSRLFGIRIEERNSDWVRTWAFKINEDNAKREGYITERTTGSLSSTDGYPGCPYCGSHHFAQCSCGKLFCFQDKKQNSEKITLTCPWCNQTGDYHSVKTVHVQGGDL